MKARGRHRPIIDSRTDWRARLSATAITCGSRERASKYKLPSLTRKFDFSSRITDGRRRQQLPYGNFLSTVADACRGEQSVPVIPVSSGWNTKFNLKLGADFPVPFSSMSKRSLMPLEALLGPVLDDVGG